MKDALELVDTKKSYKLEEAIELVKSTTKVKFDATVDVVFNMNLDPTKAEQQLRGGILLPHGSGKTQKILVLAEGEEAKVAESLNVAYVGGEDLINKIKNEKWFDFDLIIATPQMMPKIGKIGQILGPKGLMPNPKIGTVTPNVKKAIDEVNAGKVTYRIDKFGNLHIVVGKVSFDNKKLEENVTSLFNEVMKIKPSTAKGIYIENLSVSSTMGPGIKIDVKSL